jgi:hypothetical protein
MANIKRANASSITKSGVAIADVPDAPTIGAVTDLGSGSTASVAYTAAVTGGTATTFTATSSPGGFIGTGSSPITVSGLADSTAYTFTVTASNSSGSAISSASSSLTLIAPGKFESIATITTSGGETDVSFTSIPGTYKSLQLRMIGGYPGSGNTSYSMRMNSDTGSNYAFHQVSGNGTTASAGGSANQTQLDLTSLPASNSGYWGVAIAEIIDYASTSKFKTVTSVGGHNDPINPSYVVKLSSGLWRSTSAITSLTLGTQGATWRANSVIALYGIKG